MLRQNLLYYILLFPFILLLFFSCGEENADTYTVSGKLENLERGHLYMSYEKGDSLLIDTISINEKGEFSHKGKVDTLTVLSLYFNENTKNTFILVDKGWKVELQGDAMYPDLINVKGGDINNDLTDFKNKNEALLKSRIDILKTAEEVTQKNDSSVVKDYVVELKNINFELSNIAAEYVKANPDKVASVMLINSFFKDETSLPRLEELLLLLKGKAVDFPLTEDLKAFKDKIKKSAVGSFAPYYAMVNLKGETLQMSNFRGKYVLLSFVSTSCDACRSEKSEMITVYNELKKQDKNIDFVTIVKDEEIEPISKAITDSVKWNIIPVKGGWGAKPFDLYYIREIPYNILISPTGYILERDLPIQDLPQKLEAMADKGLKTKQK